MGGAILCPICGNNQAYCKCTRLEKEQFLEIARLREERRWISVAWGVIATRSNQLCSSWESLADAQQESDALTFDTSVVPLYRSPPQPRGWLTEEERKAVVRAESQLGEEYSHGPSDNETAAVLRSLLARSSPPEVVLPENPYHPSGLREGFDHAIRIVRNELVNAGVAVKEVGK
jgi:hypothetical protein